MLTSYAQYAAGYVKGFMGELLHPVQSSDDPEIILSQAQQEMKEMQARNRERAVQAITQKNNLQAEVEKTTKVIANLQAKAETAHHQGDEAFAVRLEKERERHEQTLNEMQKTHAHAVVTVDHIKEALREEEGRIRTRNAEAMALKADWKQAQILMSFGEAAEKDAADRLRAAQVTWQTVLALVRRTDANLQQQAQKAARQGNTTLAEGLITEQDMFRHALLGKN